MSVCRALKTKVFRVLLFPQTTNALAPSATKMEKNTILKFFFPKEKYLPKSRSSSRSFTAFTQHIYKPRPNPHPSMQRAA